MATPMIHTPLEVLVLFQSLHSTGNDSSDFAKISDSLKTNEFIQNSENYDPSRLDPESLKNLYLRISRGEIRSERYGRNSPPKAGDPNARKRKLSTTPPSSVDKDVNNSPSLPELINRLFLQYQDHLIQGIQEDERKYRLIQQDIRELEKGDQDARVEIEDGASRRNSKGVASIQTLLQDGPEENVRPAKVNGQRPESTGLSSLSQTSQDVGNQNEAHGRSCSNGSGDISQTGSYTGAKGEDVLSPHSRTSSGNGLQQTYSPHHEAHSRQSSQSRMADSHHQPLPPLAYSTTSPSLDGFRRLPPPQSPLGVPPSASPRLGQIPLITPDRSPTSPIILPPPPGMLRSSGSAGGPLDTLADIAGQQYRANPGLPSPLQPQNHGTQNHPHTLPPPRNFSQRAYPYCDSQMPFTQPYSPYGQSHTAPYHSPNQPHPPYSGQPHGFSTNGKPSSGPHYQSPVTGYGQYHGYPAGQSPYPPNHNQNSYPERRPSIQATPIVSTERQPPQSAVVSSTRWKTVVRPSHDGTPHWPLQEFSPDFSPASSRAASPVPESTKASQKGQNLGSFRNKVMKMEDTPTRGKAQYLKFRGGRPRGSASRGRGVRDVSTASSTLPRSKGTRSRSQSETSQADELSMDAARTSTHKIKPEPPATPAGATDDNVSITSTAVGDWRMSGRRRNETNRPVDTQNPARPYKRKRAGTIEETPDPSTSFPSAKANQILASRNFPRTCMPLMNDITAHKLASLFAKPITERDAPGYHNIVYRSQDLKSIKSAISSGSRAVVAITEANSAVPEDGVSPAPTGPASKGVATLWIESSEDVVPPKGIVNSAQLEKEVCRMFANAVMFNPDPKRGFGPAFRTRSRRKIAVAKRASGRDETGEGEGGEDDEDAAEADGGGFVRDTREMFEAVEKSVGEWRAAERVGEDGRTKVKEDRRDEDDVDELAAEEEESVGLGVGRKRRRG